MYNRYIPQPDGSYRRNPMQTPPPPPKPEPKPQTAELTREPELPKSHPVSAGSFLRQLIPQGFDTGDLIVVLLLLLIAGDSQESRNHALLTIALYFIL